MIVVAAVLLHWYETVMNKKRKCESLVVAATFIISFKRNIFLHLKDSSFRSAS